jgi:hypothetical protein
MIPGAHELDRTPVAILERSFQGGAGNLLQELCFIQVNSDSLADSPRIARRILE